MTSSCAQPGCTSPASNTRGLCPRCNSQHTLNQVLDQGIFDPAWDRAWQAAEASGLSRATCLHKAKTAGEQALRAEGRRIVPPGHPRSLQAHSPWITQQYPRDARWAHLVSILPAKVRGKVTLTCRSKDHPARTSRLYTHRVSAIPPDEHTEYCPACGSGHGYRTSRPGYLYLLRAEDPTLGVVHQFGITNNPRDRLNRHRAGYDWALVEVRMHADGTRAYAVEALLKSALRARGMAGLVGAVDRRGYRLDGYTECWMVDTWPVTPLGLDHAVELALAETGADAAVRTAAAQAFPSLSPLSDLTSLYPREGLAVNRPWPSITPPPSTSGSM